MATKLVNGRRVTLTPEEEAVRNAESNANQVETDARVARETSMNAKKAAEITALGTRAKMQAATASANSIPALRARVAQLEEIIYTMAKGTID